MTHSRLPFRPLSSLLVAALLPTLVFPPQFALAQHKLESAKPTPQLDGYSLTASETERQWEEKFRALPVPGTIRENMRRLSARPASRWLALRQGQRRVDAG